MTSKSSGNGQSFGPPDEKEFFYTVLNLPTTASDYEVRERYKQLSIVFHPDKQHNETTKATAVQRFLEVQKAYEVLSDPVRRQAYDLYGVEGLKFVEASNYETLPMDELQTQLKRTKLEADRMRFSRLLVSQSSCAVNIDLSAFTELRDDLQGLPWTMRLLDRWEEMPHARGMLRQAIQYDIRPTTTLKLSASSVLGRLTGKAAASSAFVGTIRHQFSPRLTLQTSASLFTLSRPVKIKAVYSDDNNTLAVKTHLSLVWWLALYDAYARSEPRGFRLIPSSITYSRRLFPRSNTQGTLSVVAPSNSQLPSLAFTISSAHPFDFGKEVDISSSSSGVARLVPSGSGLAHGAYYHSIGLVLNGPLPGLMAELGITFAELGVQLKAAAQATLQSGLSFVLGAAWSAENGGVDAEVSLGSLGVQLKLGFVYLGHRLELPIMLSHENDLDVALWTTIVPTSMLTLAYYFVLRPLEHKRRMEFFRHARQELREVQSDLVRQYEETTHLLQDLAKRHMQAEATVDGLVIVEATYGPTIRDGNTEGLEIDVTIPLQALVNKSQLYIPGRRSKAGLQGFRDPVPNVAKSLRVRYSFRGREHYAEVPDYRPTVLPLEDHLVQ